MAHFVASLYLLGSFLNTLTPCTVPASHFQLEGDYFIGGLFDIHLVSNPVYHDRPEGTDCSSQPLILSSYRRFQLMRFTVEEINNSSSLLPNVSLGYDIFDLCSSTGSFPGIFKLVSVNGMIQPWHDPQTHLSAVSKVIAVVGPYTSTDTLTVAPFFMVDFIPLVSYGATSDIFSKKVKFPSFLRTVHPNKDIIAVIVKLIVSFNWRWVAFLNSDDDYGRNGLELFVKSIENTEICLAYSDDLSHVTNYSQMFRHMEAQGVSVIVVFAPEWTAEVLIDSAIQLNISDKVWIAGDTWSLNKNLPKRKEIRTIGTVLGVSQPVVTIPGFSDFILSSENQSRCENTGKQMLCNQVCNCSGLSPEKINAMDPSFSFPIYSAVYAVAHALHKVLQCGAGRCHDNITVFPHMVLAALKKSNFTLLNQSIQFDENGDPTFGFYSIVYWNPKGDAEEFGFYEFLPSVFFFINNTKIQWHKNTVPTSLCSQECHVGYAKTQDGIHKCCFTCEICPKGTYVNHTEDAYKCINCKDTEWSTAGSTSCSPREVEYVPFTDVSAILIMVGAWALVGLALATSVLFAVNYNTPVVRSAGGPMCFLILGCLCASSSSVFFYFGRPTFSFCVLRFLPFFLFYTACLACFVVRSFQIVCIFKMAAKFPRLHSWWLKYNGQRLVIMVAFAAQALLSLVAFFVKSPKPNSETTWFPDKIMLNCNYSNFKPYCGSWILLFCLCTLCFIFAYMGKDLPKNYNEAKAITFCLLLLILTWIILVTINQIYHGKYIHSLNALAVLSSLYSFLLWYFLPKCYIIIFQPYRNTQQYFQGLIQNYTKTISQ